MKRIITMLLALLMASTFAGCHLHADRPEEIWDQLDTFAAQLGQAQITTDDDLIGVRACADMYTGDYAAACDHTTGRDVVFGGSSLKSWEINVSGRVLTKSGKAVIRIRQNWKVTEYAVNADGTFETTIRLSAGGNYMMVEYENFCGTVELKSTYTDTEADLEYTQ
jgi:hypothetical protein